VKTVSLCKALNRRKLHLKLQKFADLNRAVSYGVGDIFQFFMTSHRHFSYSFLEEMGGGNDFLFVRSYAYNLKKIGH